MKRPKLCSTALSVFALTFLIGLSEVNARAQDAEGQPTSAAIATPQQLQGPHVAKNLRLFITTIRTEDTPLALGPISAAAFRPTTVTCPVFASLGCAIKVTVSSEFRGIDPGTVARMYVTIDGPGALAVDPNSLVDVDSTTTVSRRSVRTFQWMKRIIPAGATEIVGIQFQVSAGAGFAGSRTATTELYRY